MGSRALATDLDLRGRVAAWEARLQPLADRIEPHEANQAVWTRIERDLIQLKR